MVFAEGCVTNGTAVIKFKTGAFTLNAPILPVAVSYNVPSGATPALTAATTKHDWLTAIRFFFDPIKTVTVEFLPEQITPKMQPDGSFSEGSLEAVANKTGRMIADAIGRPYHPDLDVTDAVNFFGTLKRRVKRNEYWIPKQAWQRAQKLIKLVEERQRQADKKRKV